MGRAQGSDLVKHYPKAVECPGKSFPNTFPVGGSCSTAFAEGPEGASWVRMGQGHCWVGMGGRGGGGYPREDAPGSEEGGEGHQEGAIPPSVPAQLL